MIVIIILLTKFFYATDINLLSLKKHWQGYGKAVQYSQKILLATPKIKNQISLMTTNQPFILNKDFSIDVEIKMTCSNPNQSVGFSLAINQVPSKIQDRFYQIENYFDLYGQYSEVDGIMLVLKDNLLMFNQYHTSNLTRSEFEKIAKKCKIYTNENSIYKFTLYYKDNHFSVMNFDHGEVGQICAQIKDVKLRDFYLTVSSGVKDNSCVIDVTKLVLNTSSNFSFIDSDQKEEGDGEYAYFEKDRNEQSITEDNLIDFSKILAPKLLSFADMNQKELKISLKEGMKKQSKIIDEALSLVKKEALLLQNMGDYLSNFQKNENENLDEIFEKINNWLEQADQSYMQQDKSLAELENLLNEVSIDKYIQEFRKDTNEIYGVMKRIQKKTQKIKNTALQSDLFEAEKINELDYEYTKQMIQERIIKENSKESIQESSLLSNFGKIVLLSMMFIILGGFGFMYYRVKQSYSISKRYEQLIIRKIHLFIIIY